MPGPKYTPGQRVELLATDFETDGFPEVWMTGTIVAMQRVELLGIDPVTGRTAVVDLMDDVRWDVEVALDNGRRPRWAVVGQRGGNKLIRAL